VNLIQLYTMVAMLNAYNAQQRRIAASAQQAAQPPGKPRFKGMA